METPRLWWWVLAFCALKSNTSRAIYQTSKCNIHGLIKQKCQNDFENVMTRVICSIYNHLHIHSSVAIFFPSVLIDFCLHSNWSCAVADKLIFCLFINHLSFCIIDYLCLIWKQYHERLNQNLLIISQKVMK